MYLFLKEQNTRPRLFSAYTAEELWTDPHVAQQMLSLHLDPEQALASRPHDFIERSVAWLSHRFDLASGKRVLDLGCGPGLYANGLAGAGSRVTGVDFSAPSLAHARAVAGRSGLTAAYHQANYLEFEADGLFDVILLIYGDFCALSPTQRCALLEKVKSWLAPRGRFVFDVFSTALFGDLEEEVHYEEAPEGGFWSSEPYFLFTNRFKYAEDKAYLDRFAVVRPDGCRELFNWIQCYDPARLSAELEAAGWTVENVLGNVAGDAYDPDSADFAVVARAEA